MRELVAKVMLPVIEASWSTGGMELAAKVSQFLFTHSQINYGHSYSVSSQVLAILPSDSLPGGLKKRLEGN